MSRKHHIAKFLLFSYAIILAHNIIPHHHHWEPDGHTVLCSHEHQQDQFPEGSLIILDDEHNEGDQIACQFREQSFHSRSLDPGEFYIAEELRLNYSHLQANQHLEKGDILIIDDPGTLSHTKRGPPCMG